MKMVLMPNQNFFALLYACRLFLLAMHASAPILRFDLVDNFCLMNSQAEYKRNDNWKYLEYDAFDGVYMIISVAATNSKEMLLTFC